MILTLKTQNVYFEKLPLWRRGCEAKNGNRLKFRQ